MHRLYQESNIFRRKLIICRMKIEIGRCLLERRQRCSRVGRISI